MRVRALTDFGGLWEGKMFFGQTGQEMDLPDELAKSLVKAGRVEKLARAKVTDKPASRARNTKD
jgi:hypothetical protein